MSSFNNFVSFIYNNTFIRVSKTSHFPYLLSFRDKINLISPSNISSSIISRFSLCDSIFICMWNFCTRSPSSSHGLFVLLKIVSLVLNSKVLPKNSSRLHYIMEEYLSDLRNIPLSPIEYLKKIKTPNDRSSFGLFYKEYDPWLLFNESLLIHILWLESDSSESFSFDPLRIKAKELFPSGDERFTFCIFVIDILEIAYSISPLEVFEWPTIFKVFYPSSQFNLYSLSKQIKEIKSLNSEDSSNLELLCRSILILCDFLSMVDLWLPLLTIRSCFHVQEFLKLPEFGKHKLNYSFNWLKFHSWLLGISLRYQWDFLFITKEILSEGAIPGEFSSINYCGEFLKLPKFMFSSNTPKEFRSYWEGIFNDHNIRNSLVNSPPSGLSISFTSYLQDLFPPSKRDYFEKDKAKNISSYEEWVQFYSNRTKIRRPLRYGIHPGSSREAWSRFYKEHSFTSESSLALSYLEPVLIFRPLDSHIMEFIHNSLSWVKSCFLLASTHEKDPNNPHVFIYLKEEGNWLEFYPVSSSPSSPSLSQISIKFTNVPGKLLNTFRKDFFPSSEFEGPGIKHVIDSVLSYENHNYGLNSLISLNKKEGIRILDLISEEWKSKTFKVEASVREDFNLGPFLLETSINLQRYWLDLIFGIEIESTSSRKEFLGGYFSKFDTVPHVIFKSSYSISSSLYTGPPSVSWRYSPETWQEKFIQTNPYTSWSLNNQFSFIDYLIKIYKTPLNLVTRKGIILSHNVVLPIGLCKDLVELRDQTKVLNTEDISTYNLLVRSFFVKVLIKKKRFALLGIYYSYFVASKEIDRYELIRSYSILVGKGFFWLAKVKFTYFHNKLSTGYNIVPVHFNRWKDKWDNNLIPLDQETTVFNDKSLKLLLNSLGREVVWSTTNIALKRNSPVMNRELPGSIETELVKFYQYYGEPKEIVTLDSKPYPENVTSSTYIKLPANTKFYKPPNFYYTLNSEVNFMGINIRDRLEKLLWELDKDTVYNKDFKDLSLPPDFWNSLNYLLPYYPFNLYYQTNPLFISNLLKLIDLLEDIKNKEK